ncbi:alanine racemase [Pseudokineococcus sp. 1T1Z-3]|uniref:alanine racemase n=1 Tax=Pseudokineococcus sp. 1T1Z-3 TaxID=3132745 RepID=UPI0030988605
MPLVLHVDDDRWLAHLQRTAERLPGLVPVAKGNGYGFGLTRLARRAQALGVDTVAVGLHEELPAVAEAFDGSLLVLAPHRPHQPRPADLGVDPDRVVSTVGRTADLRDLVARSDTAPRVVLERLTSMTRHGADAEMPALVDLAAELGCRVEGVALHLPLPTGGAWPRPGRLRRVASAARGSGHVEEVRRLLAEPALAGLAASGDAAAQVWVSHLEAGELAQLAGELPDRRLRPRTGTSLWLGDPGALRVTATVLDAHPVARGDAVGYRQRPSRRAGTVLVVAGGTSHGVGMAAPTGAGSLRARAATVARGLLDAAGRVRSPYAVGGGRASFVEPPHMQVSMVFVPAGAAVPAVGDEVAVRVRNTTTDVDRVDSAL